MAAGTRTTKALFLICTLLSLVCFTISLSDKDKLTEVKERHQQTKENLERLKSQINSAIDFFSYTMKNDEDEIAPVIEMMKQYGGEIPDELLPLDTALKKLKDTMRNAKTVIKKVYYDLGVKIKENEEMNDQNEMIINGLENQRVEL